VAPRWRFLLALILALGAALRIGFYLSRPSLSIDETMLGLELGTRSYAGLLHPLDYAQTAPFPFLWLSRLASTWFGMNEFALRALPLLAGLAVPVLVWRVGRRLLPEPTALAATGLAAFAPTLVTYSVTVKPYITDAAIALILVDLTLDLLDHPEDARPWWLLGAAGLVAVAGSAPAPFLLAGVVAAIVMRTRDPVAMRRLAACLTLWAATFLPLYLKLYRPVATSDYMQQFWGESFFQPLQLAGWRLVGRSLVQALVARPAPLGAILALVALLGVGWWWLWRRRGRPVAALCGVPLLGLLSASVLHRYPLSARVLVFTAPALLLCCGAALAAIGERHGGAGRALAWATVLLLAAIDVTHPYRTPATREGIAALIGRAGATEPVYLSSGTIPAWAFYTTDWSAPDTAYLRHIRRWAGGPAAPAFHNLAPRGRAVRETDGDDLEVRHLGRLEILGLAPGIQWREVSGLTGRVPDAGWADREAARIRAAAPVVWLLMANAYAETSAALLAALDRAGGRVDVDSVAHGVRRSRVRFTSATRATGSR
jgi:hypothetical protein